MQYEKILYLYPIKRYSKTVVGPGVSSTYFTSHSTAYSLARIPKVKYVYCIQPHCKPYCTTYILKLLRPIDNSLLYIYVYQAHSFPPF